MDPSSGKYSIVGEGGAIGPVVDWNTVTLACDSGVEDVDTFPGKYPLVDELPTRIVLTGVSVTNLVTKWLETWLVVGLAKPDPIGLKPREEPEPNGSV